MFIEHDRAKRYYEDGNWKESYSSDRGPLTSKMSVYSYNALSVNCEHDWKVSATIH